MCHVSHLSYVMVCVLVLVLATLSSNPPVSMIFHVQRFQDDRPPFLWWFSPTSVSVDPVFEAQLVQIIAQRLHS